MFNNQNAPSIYLVKTENFKGLSFKNMNNDVIHSVIDFYTPLLNEFYTWLKERHVEVYPIQTNNGKGGFGFKDPDGNILGATNIVNMDQ